MNKNNLIWIDLEMTGLEPSSDRIIEIATIVTNYELDVVAEGPSFAIYQPQEILTNMDGWNTLHHTGSGLVDRVKASDISVGIAEKQTLEFLEQYVIKGKSPMCGNSICQDRRFLVNYMPTLEQFFHYRHLDVSTIKILANTWFPDIAKGIEKKSQHLALYDVRDSIEELKYYRKYIFRKQDDK